MITCLCLSARAFWSVSEELWRGDKPTRFNILELYSPAGEIQCVTDGMVFRQQWQPTGSFMCLWYMCESCGWWSRFLNGITDADWKLKGEGGTRVSLWVEKVKTVQAHLSCMGWLLGCEVVVVWTVWLVGFFHSFDYF